MAFGIELMEGSAGKIFLSVFRLIAVGFGLVYMRRISRSTHATDLFIYCLAFIIAGASGNLIDSLFYGQIFTESTPHQVAEFTSYGTGYAPLFEGKVVDMLYFPLFEFYWPRWIPFIGGDHFLFFAPIFNIADFVITLGLLTVLFFQKRMFNTPKQ